MQSFDREREPVTEPSAWITRYARLVPPGGQVLDLACGHGRHARWLLDKGYRVLAADIDTGAVIDLCEHPHAEVLEVDLESGDWPFPPGSFAGIVVANYLHRPHFPHLVEALTDGGVLLFETFARGNEAFGTPISCWAPANCWTPFSGGCKSSPTSMDWNGGRGRPFGSACAR